CGACGAPCAPGETCVDEGCRAAGGGGGAVVCPGGQSDCGGGVCTDVTTDSHNCGVCGFTCAAGETCTGGSCVGQAAPAQAARNAARGPAPVPGVDECATQGLTDCGGFCADTAN